MDAAHQQQSELTLVREQLERLTQTIATMGVAKPATTTVANLIEWWCEAYLPRLSSARDRKHNLDAYVLPVLGGYTEDTLTPDIIEKALSDLQDDLAPQTLNHIRAALSKVINDAQHSRVGGIPRWKGPNPCKAVKKRQVPEKEPYILSKEEAWALIQAEPEQWGGIIPLAIYLGPRCGEIRSLRIDEIDLVKRRMAVKRGGRRITTKTGKERSMPIPDELLPHLEDAIKRSKGPWLFTDSRGQQLGKNWKGGALLKQAMKAAKVLWGAEHYCCQPCNHRVRLALVTPRLCERCGERQRRIFIPKKMTFHDLRHNSATLHQDAGCHPWVMSKVLGHSKGNMTARYTHLSEEAIRAELNKLRLAPRSPFEPSNPSGGGMVGTESQSVSGARSSAGQSIGLLSRLPAQPRNRGRSVANPPQLGVQPRTAPLHRRFWPHVQKGEGCWLWTAGVNSSNYGVIKDGGHVLMAHRVAAELSGNVLGPDEVVRHLCNTSRCVRPDHLEIGTHADNVADRVAAGRSAKGEQNGRAKLTTEKVIAILVASADHGDTPAELARKHGVDPKAIRQILAGKTWRHVEVGQ